MENVIVTGATGMIGASMIEQMVADGVHVTAVCRPNSKKRNNLINNPLVTVVECDINDLISLKEKLSSDYDTFYILRGMEHMETAVMMRYFRNRIYIIHLLL